MNRQQHPTRRRWMALAVMPMVAGIVAVASTGSAAARTTNALPPVQVWKDPNCGCCQLWVDYLQSHGFAVQVHDTGNNGARAQLGMPRELGSCHTALVAGYVIEGHVPVDDLLRLLRERPAALGLAVPRMPIGSPGMDSPIYQGRRDAYDVLLVRRDGSTRRWQRYEAIAPRPAAAPPQRS